MSPASRLSSQLFLDRMKPNALAPYLAPLYEMFFRAEDPEKIQLILDQAYVDTAELREYDLVLHSMLRQIERTSDYRTIQTDRHREYTLTPEIGRYGEGEASRRPAAPHHRLARRGQVAVHLPLLHAPHARGAQEPGRVVHHRLQPRAVVHREYRDVHLREIRGGVPEPPVRPVLARRASTASSRWRSTDCSAGRSRSSPTRPRSSGCSRPSFCA